MKRELAIALRTPLAVFALPFVIAYGATVFLVGGLLLYPLRILFYLVLFPFVALFGTRYAVENFKMEWGLGGIWELSWNPYNDLIEWWFVRG